MLRKRLTFVLQMVQLLAAYRFLPEQEVIQRSYLSYNSDTILNISDAPHHALIVYGTRYCSGSLIGSRIVVTAASCFVKRKDESVIVKIGSSSVTAPGQVIPVVEIKIHEYFKQLSHLDNDIAMLVLKDHVKFDSTVIKTLIVESEVALKDGVEVIVTGWGATDLPGKYLNLLLKSEMLVTNRDECLEHYDNLVTRSNYCVRYNVKRRLSDNGGGAIYRNLLVGILSSGTDDKNKYAILTNVSYFRRWILLNTYKSLNKYCSVRNKVFSFLGDESMDYNDT